MELTNYLDKFTLPKKNQTEEQILAGECYEYFGKQLPFGRIMAEIQRKGKIYVREVLEAIKKDNPKDRLSLFIWKLKQAKVIHT